MVTLSRRWWDMKIKRLVTLRYYLHYSNQSKVFHQNNQQSYWNWLSHLEITFMSRLKQVMGGKNLHFSGVTCCFLCIWRKSINHLHFYMPKCISVMLRLKQFLVLKSSLNTNFEIITQDLTDRIHCNEKM